MSDDFFSELFSTKPSEEALAQRLDATPLRKLREEKTTMSQKTFAEKVMKIKPSTYSLYEKGVRPLPYEKLVFLADYYNTTTDFLLGRSKIQTAKTDIVAICEYTGLTESTVQKLHESVLPLLKPFWEAPTINANGRRINFINDLCDFEKFDCLVDAYAAFLSGGKRSFENPFAPLTDEEREENERFHNLTSKEGELDCIKLFMRFLDEKNWRE